MSEAELFADLMHRVRAGEAQAADAFVRRYEPVVRRLIRLQLEDSKLNRLVDSVDICQSVLASFFLRARAGQFELEAQAHMMALLKKMALNKVAWVAHRHRRQRRNMAPAELASGELQAVAGQAPTPARSSPARNCWPSSAAA